MLNSGYKKELWRAPTPPAAGAASARRRRAALQVCSIGFLDDAQLLMPRAEI